MSFLKRNPVVKSLALAFGLRVFYLLLAWSSRHWPVVQQSAVYPFAPAGWKPESFNGLFRVWFQWDAGWYFRIVREGYAAPGTTAFAPLFPWLWRWASRWTGGDPLLVALLLNTLLAAAALSAWTKLAPRLVAMPRPPRVAYARFQDAFDYDARV